MRFLIIVIIVLASAALGAGCQSSGSVGTASTSNGAAAAAPAAAGEHTAVLYVHGMGCPQCAHNVDLQLMKVRGVEAVAIDMGSGRVTAQLSEAQPPTREQLAEAIRQTGFTLVRIEMP